MGRATCVSRLLAGCRPGGTDRSGRRTSHHRAAGDHPCGHRGEYAHCRHPDWTPHWIAWFRDPRTSPRLLSPAGRTEVWELGPVQVLQRDAEVPEVDRPFLRDGQLDRTAYGLAGCGLAEPNS